VRHPCNGDIGLQQQSGLCDSDDSAQFGLSPADDESETSDARTLKCRSAGRVAMRARSARPLPNPKCGSAVAATLATPPAPLSPVYTDVVRRESMAVTVLIGNFVAGYRATAVRARERNGSRAFNRDQAPATTTFGAEVLANNATSVPPLSNVFTLYAAKLCSPLAIASNRNRPERRLPILLGPSRTNPRLSCHAEPHGTAPVDASLS